MDFDSWLRFGMEQGWCGPTVCSTHDGIPTTREQDEAWESGDDLCVFVVRMYESPEEKKSVEENHSPSVWRNNYR